MCDFVVFVKHSNCGWWLCGCSEGLGFEIGVLWSNRQGRHKQPEDRIESGGISDGDVMMFCFCCVSG